SLRKKGSAPLLHFAGRRPYATKGSYTRKARRKACGAALRRMKALRKKASGTSAEHVARLRLPDISIRVLLEEESLLHQLAPGFPDRIDESVVVPIPLLERLAWVSARAPLRLRLREGEIGPGQAAEIAGPVSRRAHVPA